MNIEDYREYCLSLGEDMEEKLRQAFQKVRIRFNRDDLKAYNSLSGFPIRQENWFDPWEFFKTYPIREVVRNGVVYRAEEFCC